jgi:c-di-GMP-binding flagellar brake protein YcgR
MERRKFTRFRAQKNAYAALRGDDTKVGKIYDISLNGMAFRYLAEKACSETFSQVDIFLSDNGFHLSGVPCAIVCNEKECEYISAKIIPYRCGLKFEKMNEKQQHKLDFFLNNHTTGALSSHVS